MGTRRSSKETPQAGMAALFQKNPLIQADELAHVPPDVEHAQSIAESTEAMWDRMNEKNLSPSQQAELIHIRGMIQGLEESLKEYMAAEKNLLLSTKARK